MAGSRDPSEQAALRRKTMSNGYAGAKRGEVGSGPGMARKGGAVRLAFLALISAASALTALPTEATDRACTLTCDATAPSTATMCHEAAFTWSVQKGIDCNSLLDLEADFGDGFKFTWTDPVPNPIVYKYPCAGNFAWSFKFKAYPGSVTCTAQGNINIVPCEFTCDATVSLITPGLKNYRFVATVPSNTCSPEVTYWWDYGDGTVTYPCEDCGNVWHNYRSDPPWNWKLTVRRKNCNTCLATCEKEGTIDGRPCLGVGQLTLCADSISPPQNGDEYTLTGNIKVNNTLDLAGTVVYKGTLVGGVGTLTTQGDITIPLAQRPEVLATGAQVFAVEGAAGDLAFGAEAPLPSKFGGLTLYAEPSVRMRVGNGTVAMNPTFTVGIRDSWPTAKLAATVSYTKGEKKEWLATEVLQGDLTTYYTLQTMDLTYEEAGDKLTGTARVEFLYLDVVPLTVSVGLFAGCINELKFKDKPWITFYNFPGTKQRLRFSEIEGGLLDLCLFNDFQISMKGNLRTPELDPSLFSVRQADLTYLPNPNQFLLKGGAIAVFDTFSFPITAGSEIRPTPTTYALKGKASCSVKDILSGELTSWCATPNGDPYKFYFLFQGAYAGTFTVPDFPCADPACLTRKEVLKRNGAIGKAFPVKKGAKLKASYEPGLSNFSSFYGKFDLFPHTIDAKLRLKPGGVTELDLASSLVTLVVTLPPRAHRSGETAVERSAVVPAGKDLAVFSAVGQGALPDMYLRNPGGETITPANAGSFAGVSYFDDPAEKIALFEIIAPAPGTWVLGEGNLPESEVTFTALAPQPPPQISITSVTQAGGTVSATASVTPPDGNTVVGFYYSRATDGVPEGILAENLPAGSGTVSASTSTDSFSSGTYYIFASADDGVNTPVTAYGETPIQVDKGTLQPPSGLTGTRNGDAASLSWSPSPSAAATGYDILYNDTPENPGYPFTLPVGAGTSATLAGLDPEKAYRACVIAVDGQGNTSLESNAVTLPVPGSLPGDCDGSGTVSIGEVQKAINMFLGTLAPGCGVDCNGNGTVSIGEVQKVINAFLGVSSSC
jgi:hypothetical protein